QVALIERILAGLPDERRIFLFLNVSAIHQPNRHYLPGAVEDSISSHGAALSYVDRQLGKLLGMLRRRGPWLGIVCSDHGTAYGEEGYGGPRVGHPKVWEVPYAEFVLSQTEHQNGARVMA